MVYHNMLQKYTPGGVIQCLKRIVKEIYEKLEKAKHMTVATSANDYVTARTLSTIFANGKLYFQTDIDFQTIKQIKQNSSIALCMSHIQVEGNAQILGPTLDQSELAKLYQRKHPSSFDSYSSLNKTSMVEVAIAKIITWEYIEGTPYQCWYDMQRKTYRQQQYLNSI